MTPDERRFWLFNCNLCNGRHHVDDSFRPNGGYSETCDFDKQKKVDVSVNNWIRRVPPEAVTAHMNIAKQHIAKIPSEKELVIAG